MTCAAISIVLLWGNEKILCVFYMKFKSAPSIFNLIVQSFIEIRFHFYTFYMGDRSRRVKAGTDGHFLTLDNIIYNVL